METSTDNPLQEVGENASTTPQESTEPKKKQVGEIPQVNIKEALKGIITEIEQAVVAENPEVQKVTSRSFCNRDIRQSKIFPK